MATPYEKLYANILPKFRNYEISFMTEEEVKGYLQEFLIPAISRFHVCHNDLSDRDDELEQFNCDLTDLEIEILSNYMVLEYIDSTYIRTSTLLKVALPSNDFHAFSNANMLDKLTAMHSKFLWENETLLSRYAWMNGDVSKLSSGYKGSGSSYSEEEITLH